MESGFGAPVFSGTDPLFYDWGFGDPTPVSLLYFDDDTGFGSPYTNINSDAVVILSPLGTFGDDGGYVVPVLAEWPVYGPYRFRIISGESEYPETDYCYSGIIGQGYRCYSYTAGLDVVKFILPRCPVGVYDLRIEWGEGYGSYVVVPSVLAVNTRNMGVEIFAVRNALPPPFEPGLRRFKQGELLPKE